MKYNFVRSITRVTPNLPKLHFISFDLGLSQQFYVILHSYDVHKGKFYDISS
jgi:hypothetical protein